jgi:hypothetical protein
MPRWRSLTQRRSTRAFGHERSHFDIHDSGHLTIDQSRSILVAGGALSSGVAKAATLIAPSRRYREVDSRWGRQLNQCIKREIGSETNHVQEFSGRRS